MTGNPKHPGGNLLFLSKHSNRSDAIEFIVEETTSG